MSRRFWGLLASSAVVIAAVLAIVQPGGPSGQVSLAHVITATPGVEALHLELDMNVTNGSGPCDPVDASAEHRYNDTYQVAVCVTGLTEENPPIGGFTLHVSYDDTLNRAPEVADVGPALDDNPDANETSVDKDEDTVPDAGEYGGDGLGAGWDCSGDGKAYPMGDKDPTPGPGKGDAFITCEGWDGSWKLGDDETAGVLALIKFQAQGVAGTDTLTIAQGYVDLVDWDGGTCGEEEEGRDHIQCFGGTDIKVEPPHRRKTPIPTATATATATVTPTQLPPTAAFSPTPTPTMFGGPGGRVVKPPPTGSGPSGGGSPQTVWLFALAGAAGAAAAVDGFRRFARRSRT